MGIFLFLEALDHSQKIYTSAKIRERMRRPKLISNLLLLWSILEHMSIGACGACSLRGLLSWFAS